MKTGAQISSTAHRLAAFRFEWLRGWFCVGVLAVGLTNADASPGLSTADPLNFFTNVAARLLSSEMNLNLAQIQIYPTNQYTPAVHRLLQVTANLFDSTTTNFFPTIFRPYFNSDGTNIFINGYELVNAPGDTNTDPAFLTMPLDLVSSSTALAISNGSTRLNIYGIPWIIGAKKGFPNFNQVNMQSVSQITR